MDAGTSTYKDLIDSLKVHDYSTSKQLLEFGADPNCISPDDGVSPFHLAVGLNSQTSLKLVELCVQYGGDPNVRSHEGMTPVMVAASWGRFQALQILLANGGNPALRDEDEKNALDHAIGAGSWDCRQLLQEYMNVVQDSDEDDDDEPNFYYERYYNALPSLSSPSVSSPSFCSPSTESSSDDSNECDDVFHGVDVTSPDHPFAFIKAEPLPTQLDKTVVICTNDDEDHDDNDISVLDNNNEDDEGNDNKDVSLNNNCDQTALVTDSAPLEYIYYDEDCGVSLIEKRCYLDNSISNVSQDLDESNSNDETLLYDWQDKFKGKSNERENEIKNLTSEQLHLELVSHGYNPGPITPTTKEIYQNKLIQLKEEREKKQINNTSKDYSQELTDFMQGCSITSEKGADVDEELMCAAFQNPDPQRKWREGIVKSSFTYLLLDPRVTRNLPQRSKNLSDSETFKIFLSAVFYIGKGKRGRPYAHFYEGLEQLRNPRMKPSSKVQHIVDIWGCGLGVVSLHVFQGVIPVEAYTREACMVDSLSLERLTNARRGDYYGVASTWPPKRQKRLGSHLLHKCMQIFLIEGERQIRPVDLHGGNK